jgi:hypothetical protein
MEQKNVNDKIVKQLHALPKKVISFREHEALIECILHDLSHEECLNLNKIAYFIYNPDFYICKGIAGILKEEIKEWKACPWENIDSFKELVKKSSFNKKINSIYINTKDNQKTASVIEELRKTFFNENFLHHTWTILHNNVGILFYESINEICDKTIDNVAGILAFCPIT